jgi:uncharacterized protein GlcG (DUF336 family)
MKMYLTASAVLALACAATSPVSAASLLTTHRISATLAAEAVQTAVATCAAQNFPVSAILLDADGIEQAFLRGDDAGIHTLQMAHNKAYTSVSFRVDTSVLDAQAAKGQPPSPAIAKLPDLVLAPGGVAIFGGPDGKELLGAIAVSGVPNHQGDEVCAKTGLAKIADRLR